jgi:hypothetical protein
MKDHFLWRMDPYRKSDFEPSANVMTDHSRAEPLSGCAIAQCLHIGIGQTCGLFSQ